MIIRNVTHADQALQENQMPSIRIRWLMSGVLLVATLATASGQVVYKWKDSSGNVHFTDTPPPTGATLLKGPKPAPVAQAKSAPATMQDEQSMLSATCRPDITAADCEAARRALQTDLENLEPAHQQAPGNTTRTVSKDEADQQTAARANDCSMWRDVLASLEDRQNDKYPERLTASARAALPAQIADAEHRIAGSCE